MPGVRPPAVAGQFYAASPEALRRQIEEAYRSPLGPGHLPQPRGRRLEAPVALVLPHAGYRYSGPVAARGFAWLSSRGRPEAVIAVGPDHWLMGGGVALTSAEAWQTPLGKMPIARDLAVELQKACPLLAEDDAAHAQEHSVEVMVPLLQHLYGDEALPFLPLVMGRQDLEASLAVGQALAGVTKGKGVALLASTDLSHYESQERAHRLDGYAVDAILTGDPGELDRVVVRYDISMCGAGPVMAVLEACRSLGLGRPELLGYATSGDVTGEASWVVGYASLAMG